MNDRILIILMTTLGLGLAVNPCTSNINPRLLKGASWLFTGLVFQFLK